MDGPAMAVTSIGATASGLVAPAPWVVAQQPAAAASHQSAVPALHASLAHGTVLGPGGALPPAQSSSQIQHPSAALWSTIPPLATQVGGPAPAVAVPNPAEAAWAALFMSQLAAMRGGNASGGATAADHPPSGVCSTAHGRGARETASFHSTGNRSSPS